MSVSAATKKQVLATKLEQEDAVIAEALSILARRIKTLDVAADSPNAIKTYLICRFGRHEQEVFSILWLDVKNRLIEHEILFYGTLTHCSVYPREIVKSGLRVNAARSVLVHNHPSGVPEPSEADLLLTRSLVQALALVDIRVLDHIIVAGTRTHSFAEHGQI
ncbi:DNA repair protein RadC [Massilia sp. CCM 8734]|uniref:RadC family protein n=1 Tax=Massilia sp. CCM 8734 TaxID=2609283 RepID=UPI0014228455|nr:DNA repair protein RadC [Massilia sp. CCM 8734]NHZ99101.1 DNA repair protein RadC [Massilia sp. CCM 8734]